MLGLSLSRLGLGLGSGSASAFVPTLQAGMTMDLDANSLAMYGGSYPSSGSGRANLIDSVTGATFAQGGASQVTYLPNAAGPLGGLVSLGNGRSYTLLNANLPPNFMNQAQPKQCTQHFMFTSLNATGASVFLAYRGSSGRLECSKSIPTATGTLGGGITDTGDTVKLTITGSGPHVLSLTCTNINYTAQSGGGTTRIFLDGRCVVSFIGTVTGITTNDCIAFSVNGTGSTSTFNGTWLRYLYYPFWSTPARVMQDAEALLAAVPITPGRKLAIYDGSSLVQGVGGTTGTPSFSSPAATLAQLGKEDAPCVMNLAVGGITFQSMVNKISEIADLVTYLGAANVIVIACEGYNTLTTLTAAQAVAGNGPGAAGAVDYLRALITAGVLPQNIYLHTITGVGTARSGFAKYPAYAALVKAIPATYSDLALVNIIPIDTDPNLGLSPEGTAAIDGTATYRTDLTASAAAGVMTVTAQSGVALAVGMAISGAGSSNLRIASLGTGTGGTGTYNLDSAVTFGSTALKGSFPASIYGGWFGTSATGSDTLGKNDDGFNGATCSSDGVHRSGAPGFIDGVSGVISGYPLWAYRWIKNIVSAFIP